MSNPSDEPIEPNEESPETGSDVSVPPTPPESSGFEVDEETPAGGPTDAEAPEKRKSAARTSKKPKEAPAPAPPEPEPEPEPELVGEAEEDDEPVPELV